MGERVDVAVIGSDGAVAEALLELLAERRFPVGELSVLAIDAEEGTTTEFAGRPLLLEDATSFEFRQVQLAFLASDAPELIVAAERAADAGCVVVDAVGHAWRDSAIPQVIAELNPQALAAFNERGIVAAPDRIVIALAPLLRAIDSLCTPQGLSLTALLPAAELGRGALEDLARETTALLNARFYERQRYPRQIAFNVLPQDADAGVDGLTERERRVGDELGAVIGRPALAVAATLLPVPVFYGLSLNVSVQLGTEADIEAIGEAFAQLPGVEWRPALQLDEAPTPVTDAAMGLSVCVSRLRRVPGGLAFWMTVDSLRRCAALNAVASAEILIRDYL